MMSRHISANQSVRIKGQSLTQMTFCWSGVSGGLISMCFAACRPNVVLLVLLTLDECVVALMLHQTLLSKNAAD